MAPIDQAHHLNAYLSEEPVDQGWWQSAMSQAYKKWWLWLVPLAIILGLFYSSSMSYTDQSLISRLQVWLADQPLRPWMEGIHFYYGEAEISLSELGYWHFVEFFIRKGAHFFIFGLFGVSLYIPLKLTYSRRRAACLALLGTLVLACLDEGHQYFTPERAGMIEDVILDTTGGLVLIGLAYFIDGKLKRHDSK